MQALKDVYFIAYWYYILKTDKKLDFAPFEEPVNTDKKIIDEQKQLIEKLQKQLDAQQQKQQITSEKLIKFKKCSADISNNKQFNFTEKQTRQKLIDLKLNKQGWEIIDFKDDLNLENLDNVAVRELPTKDGFADYALFVKGNLLGIIEAKKISVGSKNVIEQAKRYSKDVIQGSGIWREYKVPFLYATNGETIHFLDIRNETNIQRELLEFHNAVALDEKFQQEKINFKTWLDKNPIESYYNSDKQLYPFQQKAISAAENAILDQKREMMLAMATGTGKTFTIPSLIYRLLEAKVIKRVLFLVDRKALAAQAVTAFSSFSTPHGSKFDKEYEVYSQKFQKEDFEDGATFNPNVLQNEYLTNPQPNHSFVYVSTIQRMTINLQGKYSNISEDDVKARLDKIPTALKRARQSILNQAITGELTKDWREKENIEISLIPKNIYELGDLLCGASPKSSETNVLREGIPYVSGPEQWDGKEIIVNKWTKYPKKIAPNNSIFITVKGAGVGKIFPGINAAIGRDIYAFVPNETINYSFLMLYLQNMTLEIINKAQRLIPGISKKHILQNTILLPPLEEQAEIVRRVKLVFEKLDKIELRYQKAKEYSDKLTQSILNKAFRGELVPQDPNDKPIKIPE